MAKQVLRQRRAKDGIGNIIKHLRYVQDLSSTDLADKMSVTRQYISDVEANRRDNLTQDTIAKFSVALGISPDELVRLNELGKTHGYKTPAVLREILDAMATKIVYVGGNGHV